MWKYSQSTGALTDAKGNLVATGYSGHGVGLNSPDAQAIPDVGPIPRGLWSVGYPRDTDNLGKFVMPLTPHDGTDCCGRDEFYVHGDEREHPGEHLASHGCIVLPPAARRAIWESGDHILQVVA